MLARREITTGKCYVNDSVEIIREVLKVERHTVTYNEYDLTTGKLHGAPHGEAGKAELIRWADREATDEERSRLQRTEVQDLFKPGHEIERDIFMNDERRSAEIGQASVRLASR